MAGCYSRMGLCVDGNNHRGIRCRQSNNAGKRCDGKAPLEVVLEHG
jgi:hypothetical protein